jgi:hypothetical protein
MANEHEGASAPERPTPFIGEFDVNRPTPSQAESDALASGGANLVQQKRWDLSPVDPQSWNPVEPPGRPPGSVRRAPEPKPLIGEFDVNRPTPAQAESDSLASGNPGPLVQQKRWDLSPVDPQSWNPVEPPGRPNVNTPPNPTVAPLVTGTAQVGQLLNTTDGTWTGNPAPTFTRQWRRNNTTNIIGATNPAYFLQALDQGAMVSCNVTATNSAGSIMAESNSVGPVAPAVGGEDDAGEEREHHAQPHRNGGKRR